MITKKNIKRLYELKKTIDECEEEIDKIYGGVQTKQIGEELDAR